MGILNRKSVLQKEWVGVLKRESSFLKKQENRNPSFLNRKLEKVVPQKLQETLNKAFSKAFELVFDKGTGIIEKTYGKEKFETSYKVNRYAAELDESRKNMRSFAKNADASNRKNLIISGVEGVGLGIIGVGLPDIPLYIAVVLKSIYEIALHFGFPYDTDEEKILILKIVQTALEQGEDLVKGNAEIDSLIKNGFPKEIILKDQIQRTADTLSRELLYMKFLQGFPIAGVIGGISDSIYLKRITDYASIKYHKRFLININQEKKKQG
ncbi:MAG TPA: EcsC family protein [Lachnospiraceae bacterium]|nr:EcsC family protein [Lachnospiraceae bacterium]